MNGSNSISLVRWVRFAVFLENLRYRQDRKPTSLIPKKKKKLIDKINLGEKKKTTLMYSVKEREGWFRYFLIFPLSPFYPKISPNQQMRICWARGENIQVLSKVPISFLPNQTKHLLHFLPQFLFHFPIPPKITLAKQGFSVSPLQPFHLHTNIIYSPHSNMKPTTPPQRTVTGP